MVLISHYTNHAKVMMTSSSDREQMMMTTKASATTANANNYNKNNTTSSKIGKGPSETLNSNRIDRPSFGFNY